MYSLEQQLAKRDVEVYQTEVSTIAMIGAIHHRSRNVRKLNALFQEPPKCRNSCACQTGGVAVLFVIRIKVCMQTACQVAHRSGLLHLQRHLHLKEPWLIYSHVQQHQMQLLVCNLGSEHLRRSHHQLISSCPSSQERRLSLHPLLYQLSLEDKLPVQRTTLKVSGPCCNSSEFDTYIWVVCSKVCRLKWIPKWHWLRWD